MGGVSEGEEEGKEEEEKGRKALPRALLMIRDTIVQEGGECSAFKAADALKVELAFITRMT